MIFSGFEWRNAQTPYDNHFIERHPPFCRRLQFHQPIRMSTAGHMPTIHPSKNEPVISKFTINNLQHLMVKGVKEKIERLYKVSIRFTEKDEGGYWVEIQGDVIDRRNAKVRLLVPTILLNFHKIKSAVFTLRFNQTAFTN